MERLEMWKKLKREDLDNLSSEDIGEYIFSQLKEEYANGKTPLIYWGDVKNEQFDFAPSIAIVSEEYSPLNKLKIAKSYNFFLDKLKQEYSQIEKIISKETLGSFLHGLFISEIFQMSAELELFDSEQKIETKKMKKSLDFLTENYFEEGSPVFITLGNFCPRKSDEQKNYYRKGKVENPKAYD